MNKVSILLLFLLSFVFLFSYNEEIIDSKLEYLESFPDDIEERLELAQLYNQEYMFLESTLQYINILLIEPENLQAWIGLLFVLSYQQNDDGVLGLSKDALKATNNDPTILSIVGFSLSAKQKRYRAINLFKKVMQDDRAHAEDVGLAKIKLAEQYYVIGDFYRYEKINKEYRKAQIAKNETAQNIINHQVRLFTELLIGTEKKDHLVEAFRQYINFGGIDLNFAVKRNIIDNQLANHIYTVDINNRALPVSISSQF
ncbi:MAG: hypothetical protein PHE19_05565, partial [Candidatus Cloacimonetes bacterium]|nr:hypothetical protein [Candidatus Cloacimonadota bacterium]